MGKTTISAHVFRHLYMRLKKSTVLVDFDPQFNLTQTVMKQDVYEGCKRERKTIKSVMEPHSEKSIFTVKTGLGPPPSLSDVAVKLRHLTNEPDINLSLVPGDFDLVRYSLITDLGVLSPIRDRFLKFINEAREEKELVCIDCNPSSSFMTICALLASTHVLVPVRPDRYSILGLEMLDQFINDLPVLVNKPKIIVILNGIPSRGYDSSVENSLRSHHRFGPVTLSATLPSTKLFEASAAYTGFATDKKQQWRITPKVSAVVDELGFHLGLKA